MLRECTIRLIDAIHRLSPPFCIIAGLLSTVLLGLLDHLTGRYVPFYVFYLVPVLVVTASVGRLGGIVLSLSAAAAWFIADHLPIAQADEIYRPVVNGAAGIMAFVIPSGILSVLVDALRHEKEQARMDPLTGVANLRAFHANAREELERCRRYERPFSLAYIDLDRFKCVNDTCGHAVGDVVLKEIALAIQQSTRANDTVGRLGGDEFALLMPETEAQAAKAVVDRMRQRIAETCRRAEWPVSCSIGVVTCLKPPDSVDSLIGMADDLMYVVKRSGKDGVEHRNFDGTPWERKSNAHCRRRASTRRVNVKRRVQPWV